MTERQSTILDLIKQEVKPALGCTEPIAVALAVSKAVEVVLSDCPDCKNITKYDRLNCDFKIEVKVSGNILKNGMGVGIPGTGMTGLKLAAALGAICGHSEYGLQLLKDISNEDISRAKEMLKEDRVKISLSKESNEKLYVKAKVNVSDKHQACAVISGNHDRIVEIALDNQVLECNCSKPANKIIPDKNTGEFPNEENNLLAPFSLSVKEIFELSNNFEYKDIEFILEQRKLNMALSEEGLRGGYGLNVGKTILNASKEKLFGNDFLTYAMGVTAAASDARMSGCLLAAMSNGGSGNQGISVSVPVIAFASMYKKSEEQLCRALILSNLIAIHIRSYLGKLSALCGCIVAATGASCGITYLMGGEYEQLCYAIKNMIGNISGMICDGAKVGCAMKVSSGVCCAVQSAVLALKGISVSENEGIIEKDIEKTIKNLGQLGTLGMQSTDAMILDIMVCK